MTQLRNDAQPLRSAENPLPNNAPMRPAVTPPLAVIALTKASFGPRPGDVAAFDALGNNDTQRLTAWVDQQLDPSSIDDSACDALITSANFVTLNLTLEEAWSEYVRQRIVDCPADTSVSNFNNSNSYLPREELERLTMLRAAHSERQLEEVMCDFWHNHFNMQSARSVVRQLIMHLHQTVIRPNVLGNFRTLLEAVVKHTSMLYYAYAYTNTDEGENEALARKLFDNYTLGFENYLGANLLPSDVAADANGFNLGYIDADVYEAARCFTGWSVDNNDSSCDTGAFFYEAEEHDDDIKFVLGNFIWSNQAPLKDGLDVLDMLAQHPGTARHICRKLCQRLVSDEPSAALVASAAAIFQAQWQAADQLKQVVRHIVLSAEFRSSWGAKVKRPLEFAASTIRAAQLTFTYTYGDSIGNDVMGYFNEMGQRLYYWQSDEGYADSAASWLNTTSMVRRWRFANRLIERRDTNSDFLWDIISQTPVDTRSAVQLTDYWIDRLLGYALPSEARQIMLDFMAQGFNPNYALPITTDEAFHERLRMLVTLILMSPSNQWR